jgi:hypothetical protein
MNPLSKLNHTQGLQLATLAIIALAIPLGIVATQSPQILNSLATTKPLQAPPSASCVLTGCNNELCVDAGFAPLESDCSVAPRYATCLQNITCTRLTNGQCGFSLTPQANACLQEAKIAASPNQSLIQTTRISSGFLNQPVRVEIKSKPNRTLTSLQVLNLPSGLTASCTQQSCIITGTPTQTGHNQLVISAKSTSGTEEQILVPFTIRAGGTLQRTQ